MGLTWLQFYPMKPEVFGEISLKRDAIGSIRATPSPDENPSANVFQSSPLTLVIHSPSSTFPSSLSLSPSQFQPCLLLWTRPPVVSVFPSFNSRAWPPTRARILFCISRPHGPRTPSIAFHASPTWKLATGRPVEMKGGRRSERKEKQTEECRTCETMRRGVYYVPREIVPKASE